MAGEGDLQRVLQEGPGELLGPADSGVGLGAPGARGTCTCQTPTDTASR